MALIKKVKFEVTVECWERDADLVEPARGADVELVGRDAA